MAVWPSLPFCCGCGQDALRNPSSDSLFREAVQLLHDRAGRHDFEGRAGDELQLVEVGKSYSYARANFAQLLAQVVDNREEVVIKRRGHPDVALIAADDLRSMQETLYLVSSPANAERLLTALERARAEPLEPSSVAALR